MSEFFSKLPREQDSDDDVELSDSDNSEKDNCESDGDDGIDLGSEDSDGSGADDDDDDESGDAGRKSAKRRKITPVKRSVNGDEISLCFFPVGTVPGNPLAVLGVSYVAVRVVEEKVFFDRFKEACGDAPPSPAQESNYDFFEKQTDPEAPVPRHFCQKTRTEDLLFRMRAVPGVAEIQRRVLESMRDSASRARRVVVYCTATFETEQEVRAHSSPLVCYPLKGRLTSAAARTSDWQTATEWPTAELDVVNASVNAALITRAVFERCCPEKPPASYCMARQPSAFASVFTVAVTGRSQFPIINVNTPVSTSFRFSTCKRSASFGDFVGSTKEITPRRILSAFDRTNYYVPKSGNFEPIFGRKAEQPPSMCSMICQRDEQMRALLVRKSTRPSTIALLRSCICQSTVRGLMLFEDAIACLRQERAPELTIAGTRAFIVATHLLPAMAPSNFWQIVDEVGFDLAVRVFIDGVEKKFSAMLASTSPHSALFDAKFIPYNLDKNATFARRLSERQNSTTASIEGFNFLCKQVIEHLVQPNSEAHFISRPDVDAGVRALCWPADALSPLAAVELQLAGGRSTTFISERVCMGLDAMIAAALVHGTERNIGLARSDSTAELRELVDAQTRRRDRRFLFLLGDDAEEIAFWKGKREAFADTTCIIQLGDFRHPETNAMCVPVVSGAAEVKWHLVVPRADTFARKKLAFVFIALFAGRVSDKDMQQSTWARSIFGSADSEDFRATKTAFATGMCSGNECLLGGLALPRRGSLVEDLYFSGVVEEFNINEGYETVSELRRKATCDDGGNQFFCFSKKARVDNRPLETLLRELNERNADVPTLLLSCESVRGTVGDSACQRFKRSVTVKMPASLDALKLPPGGFTAIVLDCVADNVLFVPKKGAQGGPSYAFDRMPEVYKREIVNLIVDDHREAKSAGNAGFSLSAMIALLELEPQSIFVFGSAEQSIEKRITAQQHAPWFLAPPARTRMGRKWHENSEATQLSPLCWLIAKLCVDK